MWRVAGLFNLLAAHTHTHTHTHTLGRTVSFSAERFIDRLNDEIRLVYRDDLGNY